MQLFEVAEAAEDTAAARSTVLVRGKDLDLHTIELRTGSSCEALATDRLAVNAATSVLRHKCTAGAVSEEAWWQKAARGH